MTRHHPGPPVVLVGARPAEGHATLTRRGIPFVRIADPGEPLKQAGAGVLAAHRAPYRDDPTSLLPATLLCEALGLPSVSEGAVLRTRDKLVMRRALPATCPGPAFASSARTSRTQATSPSSHSHERPGHVVVGAGSRDELHTRVPAVEEALSPVLHRACDPVSVAPPPLPAS
ncbi:hypothetical protein ACWD0J_07945 [Streptomyces sp. NPDC003011]